MTKIDERRELLLRTKMKDIIMSSPTPERFDKYLINAGFYTASASTKYHGAHEGGLFDHSFAVMNCLVNLTEHNGLKWRRQESPYIVGLFHDLCKIDQYRAQLNADCPEVKWEFNALTTLKGHGDKSVMLLSQFLTLTEEEILCIRYHMGAFVDKEEWCDYTNAVQLYENVLWTHHADMLATHVVGI